MNTAQATNLRELERARVTLAALLALYKESRDEGNWDYVEIVQLHIDATRDEINLLERITA